MRTRRTYFNTSEEKRPNQLPVKVEQRIDKIDQQQHGLYRVVDTLVDMHKIPNQERVFGMLVSVVSDVIKKLNKTYMLVDLGNRRNYGDNDNWQVFSNANNEILGLNGQHFENVMKVTIVHGMNRWPIQYVLIDEEGNEIFGRVKFINHDMFQVEFDHSEVSGYMFYYA